MSNPLSLGDHYYSVTLTTPLTWQSLRYYLQQNKNTNLPFLSYIACNSWRAWRWLGDAKRGCLLLFDWSVWKPPASAKVMNNLWAGFVLSSQCWAAGPIVGPCTAAGHGQRSGSGHRPLSMCMTRDWHRRRSNHSWPIFINLETEIDEPASQMLD